jgi:hypothetical protein
MPIVKLVAEVENTKKRERERERQADLGEVDQALTGGVHEIHVVIFFQVIACEC